MRDKGAGWVNLVSGAVIVGALLLRFLSFLSIIAYGSAAIGDLAERMWKPLGGPAMFLGIIAIAVGLPVVAFLLLRTTLRLLVAAFAHGRFG